VNVIFACNQILNVFMVRAAMAGQDAVSCQLSPAMLAAWEMNLRSTGTALAEEIEIDPQAIFEFLDKGPKTVAGLPVTIDTEMPITEIWFKDPAGLVVGKIEGLAVPMAFSADLDRQQRQTTSTLAPA
jgi:hypothetical protein